MTDNNVEIIPVNTLGALHLIHLATVTHCFKTNITNTKRSQADDGKEKR